MTVRPYLRRAVEARADDRCEYCGLAQIGQKAVFHVDHVVPRSAAGETHIGNLALACVSCSLRKGARQTAPDPATQTEATLFNPRRESWNDHFRWDGLQVVGLTATGRATVGALGLNRQLALAILQEEASRRRHPPP